MNLLVIAQYNNEPLKRPGQEKRISIRSPGMINLIRAPPKNPEWKIEPRASICVDTVGRFLNTPNTV